LKKEVFANWLQIECKLSSSSINKYTRAIKTITKELQGYDSLIPNLYNLDDPKKVETITEKYFSFPEFQDKDTRGNRMYSNALKHYKNFLESSM